MREREFFQGTSAKFLAFKNKIYPSQNINEVLKIQIKLGKVFFKTEPKNTLLAYK